MTTYKLITAKDKHDLARLACDVIASSIDLVLDQRDRCSLTLSGGSTPQATYESLAREHLPWDRVDVFLGDERWVDLNDERSNARMIRGSLLASGPGAKATFHPIPTLEFPSPEQSASAYSTLLQKHCDGAPPILDLVLLGLGNDGHTASLFPYSSALNVTDKAATVCRGNGLERVTITSSVLSSARKVIFLVSGKSKNLALNRLQDFSEPLERTPARLIQPNTEVLILADRLAVEGTL
ncbi:6-phosphogluconolactonase [Prochlorococcus sp. MIT 1341]|uniref:6-phosphogluconolactonase n=1 Tax=Prochlorococcus sp. MIT 1341 TaxID=3096221 RepID=UPI002A765636|nr:6-phosphogluconolactonase [Prochlorococcus sp. MIT 1341]